MTGGTARARAKLAARARRLHKRDGAVLPEHADELGVSTRTVYRLLGEAGPPGQAGPPPKRRDEARLPDAVAAAPGKAKRKPITKPKPSPMPAGDTISQLAGALEKLAEAQARQGDILGELLKSRHPALCKVPGLTAPPSVEPEWQPPRYSNASILVISDLHAPYQHPDVLAFLAELKHAYGFERIICTGDESDGHAISFHMSHPKAPSAAQEIEMAREFLANLHALFPTIDLTESNHGSLIYRRQAEAGLPDRAMNSYRGYLFGEHRPDGSIVFPDNIGRGWRWHDDLTIILPNGERVMFVHGYSANVKVAVRNAGVSIVQGHHHSEFEVATMQGPCGPTRFGITGGCLLWSKSFAFAYGRTFPKKPVIGCSGILDGCPVGFRMPLDADGRWTGRLPFGILPQRLAA